MSAGEFTVRAGSIADAEMDCSKFTEKAFSKTDLHEFEPAGAASQVRA